MNLPRAGFHRPFFLVRHSDKHCFNFMRLMGLHCHSDSSRMSSSTQGAHHDCTHPSHRRWPAGYRWHQLGHP
ncbi:hypothetical protein THIX_90005 [Thiomonas sp. X19]|nr:hypothetical protein THIX_90005 [Thiomonas sp. X19]